ncbi:MAG: Ger(x)C family spore germination protein [Alicyclobacillus sp.]|nr:Ger(x)C family spore germination protein [Alicyclobacillus sp.]
MRHLCAWTMMIAVLTLNGCADYTEVDNLYVVVGMALDMVAEHQLRVTADIVNPGVGAGEGDSAGAGPRQQDLVVSAQGPNLDLAINELQKSLSHRLYLSHNKVVVLSQDLVHHHLAEIMDELERNRELRRNELLVVTKGSAATLWSVQMTLNQPVALELRDVIQQWASRSKVLGSEQLSLVKHWLTPSGTAAMVWVEPEQGGAPSVRGLAIVKSDGLTLWLDAEQWNGLLWLLGDTHRLIQVVPCPSEPAGVREGVSIRWLRTSTHVQWVGTMSAPAFRVMWTGVGDIDQLCPDAHLDDSAYRALEREAAAGIAADMRKTLGLLRDTKVDAIGLQTAVYRVNPRVYRALSRYPDWWRSASVNFDIRPQIIHSNLASQSPLDSETQRPRVFTSSTFIPTATQRNDSA